MTVTTTVLVFSEKQYLAIWPNRLVPTKEFRWEVFGEVPCVGRIEKTKNPRQARMVKAGSATGNDEDHL